MSLGLGARVAVSDSTDLYGIVSYEDVELDASYYITTQLLMAIMWSRYGFWCSHLADDKFELNGSFKFIEIADESETAISEFLRYKISLINVSGGLGITRADDVDTISISAVYYF
ncbi:MAG: hypothetical protein U5L01_17860 [Rheinheimera sp.]|nr:hypothetical protein [Rheinheimera sp.]